MKSSKPKNYAADVVQSRTSTDGSKRRKALTTGQETKSVQDKSSAPDPLSTKFTVSAHANEIADLVAAIKSVSDIREDLVQSLKRKVDSNEYITVIQHIADKHLAYISNLGLFALTDTITTTSSEEPSEEDKELILAQIDAIMHSGESILYHISSMRERVQNMRRIIAVSR